MYGPSPTPEPIKDDHIRPHTLGIVTQIKVAIDMIAAVLNGPIHPRARADLEACKDKLDQAVLNAHIAGNL